MADGNSATRRRTKFLHAAVNVFWPSPDAPQPARSQEEWARIFDPNDEESLPSWYVQLPQQGGEGGALTPLHQVTKDRLKQCLSIPRGLFQSLLHEYRRVSSNEKPTLDLLVNQDRWMLNQTRSFYEPSTSLSAYRPASMLLHCFFDAVIFRCPFPHGTDEACRWRKFTEDNQGNIAQLSPFSANPYDANVTANMSAFTNLFPIETLLAIDEDGESWYWSHIWDVAFTAAQASGACESANAIGQDAQVFLSFVRPHELREAIHFFLGDGPMVYKQQYTTFMIWVTPFLRQPASITPTQKLVSLVIALHSSNIHKLWLVEGGASDMVEPRLTAGQFYLRLSRSPSALTAEYLDPRYPDNNSALKMELVFVHDPNSPGATAIKYKVLVGSQAIIDEVYLSSVAECIQHLAHDMGLVSLTEFQVAENGARARPRYHRLLQDATPITAFMQSVMFFGAPMEGFEGASLYSLSQP